jgi:hypothetical protein
VTLLRAVGRSGATEPPVQHGQREVPVLERASTSRPGNTVYLHVGIWKTPQGAIHIAAPRDKELGFHTTVNNTPGSERYHKNLYKHLDRILSEMTGQAEVPEELSK